MTTYQPGDLGIIRARTMHAPALQPTFTDTVIKRGGRKATVTRTMAGGQYVIVEAEEWGIRPAATLRVPIGDLEYRSA